MLHHTTAPDSSPAVSTRFVHASGGRLVAPDGTPLLLRGMGLGNWLLPEGYMWGFGDHAASPRQIEHLIERLLGPQDAACFWREFRARFISEDDIREIAVMALELDPAWRCAPKPPAPPRSRPPRPGTRT